MNVWSILSLGFIFSTLILQIVNYKAFHGDTSGNNTRITLMVKEAAFSGHALMLWYVTENVKSDFPLWFGHLFGAFFFIGVACWFFVWYKGSYGKKS